MSFLAYLLTLLSGFFSSFLATGGLSIPPENIRKPEVFRCFQGVSKEISDMKRVNWESFQTRLNIHHKVWIYKKEKRTQMNRYKNK